MNAKRAAQIIKQHVAERDSKAGEGGMNSATYYLRRVGDEVQRRDEDLSDDILSGRGPGSEQAARRIIRLAKKINAK